MRDSSLGAHCFRNSSITDFFWQWPLVFNLQYIWELNKKPLNTILPLEIKRNSQWVASVWLKVRLDFHFLFSRLVECFTFYGQLKSQVWTTSNGTTYICYCKKVRGQSNYCLSSLAAILVSGFSHFRRLLDGYTMHYSFIRIFDHMLLSILKDWLKFLLKIDIFSFNIVLFSLFWLAGIILVQVSVSFFVFSLAEYSSITILRWA